MNSNETPASAPFILNDEDERLKRLRRYEARERRHRMAGVLFNGLVLFLVWLLYREDFDRNQFVVRDAFYRLKYGFVTMGLIATFATTVILAYRLNKVEKAQDKTEPDL
jgi:hypothetical protein